MYRIIVHIDHCGCQGEYAGHGAVNLESIHVGDGCPAAHAAFHRMPPSHQEEYLVYMNSLKRPKTIKRTIQKAAAQLLKKS